MAHLVHRLARNPLEKICRSKGTQESTYEIKLLEETLMKTATLLQIGLGEAGSSIISRNIQSEGTFHCIVPGTKIHAVFGFCYIEKFTDITDCLKEEVMLYVNSIGSIVHEAVHCFHGTPNRNLGDAFLIVWKLPQHAIHEPKYASYDKPPEHLQNSIQEKNKFLKTKYRKSTALWAPSQADNALLAFIKVIVDINSSMV